MPEKTFKQKYEKYKSKYLAQVALKTGAQVGGEQVNIDRYQQMMTMIGGDIDTPASLSNMSDSE
jgi:hypothetical protein